MVIILSLIRGWIPLKLKNRELRKKYEIHDSQKTEAVIRLPGKKENFNQIMILKIILVFCRTFENVKFYQTKVKKYFLSRGN